MTSGCAPDLPAFATMFDVPFRVEDTCPFTGAPIRIAFVPHGYEHADPPDTVAALPPAGRIRPAAGGTWEQIDSAITPTPRRGSSSAETR